MVLEMMLGVDTWLGAPSVVMDLAKAVGQVYALHGAMKNNIDLFKVEVGLDPFSPSGAFTVNGVVVFLEYREAQECARGILAEQARKKYGPLPEATERMLVPPERTWELYQKGVANARNPVLAPLIPAGGMPNFVLE